jgi:hypothetical protein
MQRQLKQHPHLIPSTTKARHHEPTSVMVVYFYNPNIQKTALTAWIPADKPKKETAPPSFSLRLSGVRGYRVVGMIMGSVV